MAVSPGWASRLRTALQRWSGSDGAEDHAELIERAFAVIAPALDTVER
ncbi:hypothetical protein ACWGI8_18475 [Streptomyces sp. NPDC054841]